MAFEDVLLRLGVNDANVRAALGRVAGDVGQLKRTLEGAFETAGIGVAARQLAAFVKSGADAADQIGKMAQKAGLTVEAMSGLAYAAKLGDVEVGDLGGSLAKLAKTMGDAAQGGKSQAAIFKALGVEWRDAEGNLRSTGAVLEDIADRFAGAEDGAAKAAFAQELFGRSGAALIPFLNQGAKGIRALSDEASDLGLIVSEKTAKAADEFNDALDRLQLLGQGLAVQIAAELTPALTGLAGSFTDTAREAGGARTAAEEVADTLRVLGSVAIATWGVLQTGAAHAAAPIAALALAAQGEFAAAGQALKNWGSSVDAEWERMRERLDAIWNGGDGSGLQGTLTRTGGPPLPAKGTLRMPGAGDGGKAAKAEAKALADAMRDFNALVQQAEAVMDSVATPAEKYALQLRDLDALLAKGAIDQETHARAVAAAAADYFEASGGAASLADEMERFNALVADYEAAVDEAATPLDRYNAQMERLQRLMETTPLTGEQATALAKKYADELDRATGKIDRMAEAWRNFGDGFESVLEQQMVDGFKDGLRGMLEAFGDMIRRMLAQAAAARLSETLLGGLATLGKGALSGLGGGTVAGPTQLGGPDFEFTGYGGERAAGGSVRSGMTYLVGEEGPELLQMPAGLSGQIIPNHELAQAQQGARAPQKLLIGWDERWGRMTVRDLFEQMLAEEAATR